MNLAADQDNASDDNKELKLCEELATSPRQKRCYAERDHKQDSGDRPHGGSKPGWIIPPKFPQQKNGKHTRWNATPEDVVRERFGGGAEKNKGEKCGE